MCVRVADDLSSVAGASAVALQSSLRSAHVGSDQSGGSAAAEGLAQVLTLGLPPLVQDGDVGADGEVSDARIEEILRLIRAGNLGARRHAHLDGRLEHAALYHA